MNETYQHPGKWHDVILTPDREETFSHVMSHNIRGLDSGSVFEAIVQAKNRYGWNEVSDLYQFYTRGQGNLSLVQTNKHHKKIFFFQTNIFTSTIFLNFILYFFRFGRNGNSCKFNKI